MIDTADFKLTLLDCSNVDFLAETASYLENIVESTDTSGRPKIEGYTSGANGYKVIALKDKVLLKNRSLCKFHHGNNLQELSIPQTKEAIEKLSDLIHLPIKKASVTRLDVGANIETKYTPKLYYPIMQTLPYKQRLGHSDSIHYIGGTDGFKIYDKLKEAKKNTEKQILDGYREKNILRAELIAKNPKALFKQEVTGESLYNEKFAKRAIGVWQKNFNSIRKISQEEISMHGIKSKKEYQLRAFAMYVQKVGEANLLSIKKEECKNGIITRKQLADIRRLIADAVKIIQSDTKNELAEEIGQKVEQIAMLY